MNIDIITTNDNSNSLYLPSIDESYHSVNGAVSESLHIYIKLGLEYFKNFKPDIRIFEMGFGTGLNTYLTLLYAKKYQLNVNYYTCESNPLPLKIISRLNYPQILNADENNFLKIHQASWNKNTTITEGFMLFKIKDKIQNINIADNIDLVYFDAFSPSRQPELWSVDIFSAIYNKMNKGSVMVTYCAKNSFKKMLKSLSFTVEPHPGPAGKREVTRAIKT